MITVVDLKGRGEPLNLTRLLCCGLSAGLQRMKGVSINKLIRAAEGNTRSIVASSPIGGRLRTNDHSRDFNGDLSGGGCSVRLKSTLVLAEDLV